MDAPEELRQGVIAAARKAPELVHLLRLHDDFPGTSIAEILAKKTAKAQLLRGGTVEDSASAMLHPMMMDAATETPVHFVEKHIDPSYDWNDWTYRRRALKLAHLKNCKTSSQQTEASHFRQANATQVYLPALASTQTRRDNDCQPESIIKSGTKFGNFSIRLPPHPPASL